MTPADVGAVPTSRTINGKDLSGNVTLTAANVGAVPTSRTVNGHALSSNVTLTAADVGAADVETGTWTPRITNAGGVYAGLSYSMQRGRYVKLGKLVYATCDLEISSIGDNPTSGGHSATISGLPYARAHGWAGYAGGLVGWHSMPLGSALTAEISGDKSDPYILLYYYGATSVGALDIRNFASGGRLEAVTVIYETD